MYYFVLRYFFFRYYFIWISLFVNVLKTDLGVSQIELTLKKGAPGDQVWDLLCVQLASYLERGPLMWMMPLHLHVNQKSDYIYIYKGLTFFRPIVFSKELHTIKSRWSIVYIRLYFPKDIVVFSSENRFWFSKQCRPWWNATFVGISSGQIGSLLFAKVPI